MSNLKAALGRAIAEIEQFAADVEIDAELQPVSLKSGEIAGLELTGFFSAAPGNGAGTLVMNKLLEKAKSLSLPVYLRPSSSESRKFYKRFGFKKSESSPGILVWN